MGLELIRPGDKIDITYLHQNNGKKYMSSVFDIVSDTELEILMPTEEGKMVLFQIGFEAQFYFYTAKGLYTCDMVVTERQKKDNFFLLTVKRISPLKKFQRREYYRISLLLDFGYYKVSDDIASLETTDDLMDAISDENFTEQFMLAKTKDLSGGGVRFLANETLESGDKILAVLTLQNAKVDQRFYLVGEVIACSPVENMRDRWIVRAKWCYKNLKDRDTIVRYIFEEDRMTRKKENGGA